MNELYERLRAAMQADDLAIRTYLAHRANDPSECDNVTDYDECSIHIATAQACRYRDVDFGRRQLEAHRRLLQGHEDVHRCDWGEHRGGDFEPCSRVVILARGYGIEVE